MGQGNSAEPDSNTGGDPRRGSASRKTSSVVKTCYYELLAVTRDATQDEYVYAPPLHFFSFFFSPLSTILKSI